MEEDDKTDNKKDITIDSSLFEKKKRNKKSENLIEIQPKIPKKRVVTTTEEWKFNSNELIPDNQLEYINQIYKNMINDDNPCKFIKKQLQQKINGYRFQDIKKNKYEEEFFINSMEVLELMLKT